MVVGVELRRPMTLVGLVDLANGADEAAVWVVPPVVEPAAPEMIVTPPTALLSMEDGGRRGRLFCNFNQATQKQNQTKKKKQQLEISLPLTIQQIKIK